MESKLIDPRRTDALDRTAKLVRSVFQEVWQEFYTWEQDNSAKSLKSLAGQLTQCQLHWENAFESRTLPAENQPDSQETVRDGPVECFLAHSFLENGKNIRELITVPVFDIEVITPYNAYEACTPISFNLFQGDDSDDMPFVPFADDPCFDVRNHLLEYGTFSWQLADDDPDLNTIIMETARRLHLKSGISIPHIDEVNTLPLPLRTYSGISGSISASLQRDILSWPASTHASGSPLPDLPVPDSNDLRSRLQDYLTLFCPNLNCVQAHCSSHVPRQVTLDIWDERLTSNSPGVEPHKVADAKPCSKKCYLVSECTSSNYASWSRVDAENLRVTLCLSPSATSCDLAVVCRLPCREVSVMRKSLASKQLKINSNGKQNASETELFFADASPSTYTPNDPCDHIGPCTETTRCACFLNKAHCTRNCRCDAACRRRWKGCSCGRSKSLKHKTCLTDRCPCRQTGRECDLELCAPCNTKSCRNSQLQIGCPKSLEVKQSKFGLGVFITEPAKEGDLVAEYVGELIYEPTFDTRGELSEHRGRSYVYGMNSMLSNDSTFAGNEARFINHAPKKKANCTVGVYLVNGDHRIGIYAKKQIPAGAELFLDYGPEFPI